MFVQPSRQVPSCLILVSNINNVWQVAPQSINMDNNAVPNTTLCVHRTRCDISGGPDYRVIPL